ncbi:MAG: hypothetical protein IKK57_04980 [Clostridia bacterium]|nr:hypothetical protein [Clostridia bacterium]
MKMKKLALLVICLLLGTLLLTACSAGDPTGTWVLTGVKNDQSGEMEDLLTMCEAFDVSITAKITASRVEIGMADEDFMSFNYRLSGNKLVDTADDSIVRFRVEGETLTLIFEDCDMVFTRVN